MHVPDQDAPQLILPANRESVATRITGDVISPKRVLLLVPLKGLLLTSYYLGIRVEYRMPATPYFRDKKAWKGGVIDTLELTG